MEHFFIVGCQRTGTTLVRLVLESHSRVHCFDEILAYAALARGDFSLPLGVEWVGFKIPRWTEQLSEPVLRDEGLDIDCPNFYRGQKIVFLLRNVKDTVASMLKLKAGQSTWLEHWGVRIVDWKVRFCPGFRERFDRELEVVSRARDRLTATGALYWKYKTLSYFDYLARGFPVLGVRYEQLVSAPEPVLQEICCFLKIPWEQRLLNHQQLPHGELLEDGRTVGGTDPARPIHQESVGQWRQFLDEPALEDVSRIAGELEDRLPGAEAFRSRD